jgi:ketosteroid isomerase-like protein
VIKPNLVAAGDTVAGRKVMASSGAGPEAVVKRSHVAWGEFVKGDPEPAKALFSRRDDVSLGNPFGPFVRGWKQAEQTMERAASLYRDGQVVAFETISTYESEDLACIVEVERYTVKVGGADDRVPVALRVTSVLRREDGDWKIIHRHADPITAPQSAESVIQA